MANEPLSDILNKLEDSPGLRTYAQAIIDRFSLPQTVTDLTPYLHAVTLEVACVVLSGALERIVTDAKENPMELLWAPMKLRTLTEHFEELADLAAAKVGVRTGDEEWPETIEGEDTNGTKGK